ncbi:hypothetical protein Bca101_043983 [Brassica carinata]
MALALRSGTRIEWRSGGDMAFPLCFCPSQLTPLTWRTLMAIQVLGEFHGFFVGVHEILYLYYFAPLVSKPGFYHLRSRDGAPLVDEHSRGLRGNYPFGDDWDKRYVFVKVPGPLSYPIFWRTVDVSRPVSFSGEAVVKLAMEIPRHFRGGGGVAFLIARRPYVIATSGRLLGEGIFLRTQVRDMMVPRDLLIQRVRTFARWELMTERLEKRIDHWDPAGEYRRYLVLFRNVERPLGGSVRVDTPRSVVGSRFSEGSLS